jgi:starch synthase
LTLRQGKTRVYASGMKILMAASEALPYFKSGGLADVARSLPDALHARGHDVRIIHPFYPSVGNLGLQLTETEMLQVPWAGGQLELDTFEHHSSDGALGILLQHPVFQVNGSPYEDADPHAPARRFAVFSRAVVAYAQRWGADVVHLNDWQTGLVPVYSLIDGVSIPTVFAIHNLGYQGNYSPGVLDQIDVPSEFFRAENGLEFFGNIALIKGGIALADRVVTVSPTYAQEIQRPDYGAGMDGLLRFRARVLHGILNGIDHRVWNPATDPALPVHFDLDSLEGKQQNKAELLSHFRFDVAAPLCVVISRLAHQKGIDLVARALPGILDLGANVIVLGDGDQAIEAQFGEIAQRLPNRVAAFFRFDDQLARRLYAAADFLLMPSRYEPCGLGQMIAQRYGTVPIVRATGGLVDTVQDEQTGFMFADATPHALYEAVQRAITAYHDGRLDKIRRNCMRLDWSWGASAEHYEDVYRYAIGPSAS